MTISGVKPSFARNLKWAALIFLYQWAAWGLIGGVPSLWPRVIMPVLNQLHDHVYWLPLAVFYSLAFFAPWAMYSLLIYRLNIAIREPPWVRVVLCCCIAWPLMGITGAIVYRALDATGWFPFFDAGSQPLKA